MNTIQNQKIDLYIGGTKLRDGGFNSLMVTHAFPIDDADKKMDKSTVVTGKPVYVIKHTNEYILYLLIDKKVNPCDRDTFGTLSIALTITRDMQLADGKSPYTLLKTAYDKFRSEYMEPSNDGCDRFLNKDVNRADFIAIMDQYPLEKRVSAYVPMNPSGLSGTLCVPQEKMEELFRDSQYPEFGQFKEIEISSLCQTTLGLEHIEIPRPVVYSIKVNGKEIDTTMSQPDDEFDTASVLIDTEEDVKYEQMHFTLEDLLNTPEHQIKSSSGESSVTLVDNCIVCKIHKEEIQYTLEYQTIGGTENEQQNITDKISSGEIKIVMRNNTEHNDVVTFNSTSPNNATIPASWIRRTVDITPNRDGTLELDIKNKDIDNENRTVTVTIQIISRVTDTPANTFSNRHNNYPVKQTKGTQENNEKKGDNQAENSGNNIPPKKINGRILYVIWCFVGMCIGAGIVGTVWWFGGQLSYDESLQIAKEKVKTVPFEKIISIDEADTLASLRSLREAIEAKLRPQIESEIWNEIGEQKAAEAAAEEEAKAAEEEAKAAAAKAAAEKLVQARSAILSEVNRTHNIEKCRAHNNWDDLTQEDRLAVEAILNLNQYKGTIKKSVKNFLNKKSRYNSWNDIIKTRKSILEIIDESQK